MVLWSIKDSFFFFFFYIDDQVMLQFYIVSLKIAREYNLAALFKKAITSPEHVAILFSETHFS